MNAIQAWFERIAGITQEERERLAFARELYGRPSFDPAAFEKPACWRRRTGALRWRRMA
ncbi:hypothetical protein [Propionivibrio dicarboxylicus]|uniref:Uncharacterized protein n=1 Tax=Propionivibrio dicarboxylicus TaxID=83767 RepID=A0A1G7ZF96_9RHOO|nr:hypothetical protein [Propionivibrio dicarboxylicus]SDH07295.1 hypothetical protein SAMN05660652_01156 [Propionivibrio dicarboxylicus]